MVASPQQIESLRSIAPVKIRKPSPVAKIHSATRIPELDGLRGIAILLVLAHHAVFDAPTHSILLSRIFGLGRMSWSGVDLFFVLSGFLIGGILLDQRDSTGFFKTFYLRRAFRILPLYFIVIALFSLRFLHWSPGSVTQFSVSRIPVIAFVTFTQNFWMAWLGTFGVSCMAATWSLAVEEQFYLSAPFLVRKVSREKLVRILLAVVCIAPLLRILLCLIISTGRNAAYVLMPCRADALSLGVLVAVLARSQNWWDIVLQNRNSLRKFGWVILAGLLPLNLFGSAMSLPMATVGYSWLAISYAWLLIIVISRANKTLNRILSKRILRNTGVLAYSTYLLHLPMIAAFERILVWRYSSVSEPTHFAARIIAVAVTLSLAALSWKFFEGPLLRKAHKFTY